MEAIVVGQMVQAAIIEWTESAVSIKMPAETRPDEILTFQVPTDESSSIYDQADGVYVLRYVSGSDVC